MASRFTAPLLGAALIALGGCSLPFCGSAAAAAPIGDTCLVGSWTLANETNERGYTYSGNPVAMHGLAGAKVTFTAGGEEKEVFEGSQPLTGTLANGDELSISIGGSADFHIHAAGGKYTESGKLTQLPTTARVAGVPVNYQSEYTPGTGSYKCSSSSLTMTTNGGNQVDHWSKG